MKLKIKHTSGKVEPIHAGKLKDVEHLKETHGKVEKVHYGKLKEVEHL